jgi:hypothetical protein
MQLSQKAAELLVNLSGRLSGTDSLAFGQLKNEIPKMKERLERPLRVTVVGVMRAGKSTLMNALFREKILFTGNLETTYKISLFKYGEKPSLKVVFKDGTELGAEFKDLEKWTVKPDDADTERKAQLEKVEHVEIFYPNEILKKMELEDTPGNNTSTKETNDVAMRHLGIEEDDESGKITSAAASNADAILYAFSRAPSEKDAAVLQAFQGYASNSNPINAIGLFTKVDATYWRHNGAPMEVSPLDIVSDTCGRYKDALKDKLYTILPVVGKSVEMVSTMDDATFDILEKLSGAPKEVLERYLADAQGFYDRPSNDAMPVSSGDRKHVMDLFGQFGIYSIVTALKNNVSREELPGYMYETSGVGKVFELIQQHFGNRAYLIKLDYVLRRLRKLASDIKYKNHDDIQISKMCNHITEDIDRLRQEEHSFEELKILREYYEGKFTIKSDGMKKEFLQIMGEDGSNCEARLGFSGAAKTGDLKKEAQRRASAWNGISNTAIDSSLQKAARVVADSCYNMRRLLDELAGFD